MLQNFNFTYKRCKYSGYIVSSRTRLPFYHWFVLNEGSEFEGADEIVFTEDLSGLHPVDPFFEELHPSFFATVRSLIESQIARESTAHSVY